MELLVLATDSISIAGNEFESLQLPLEWSSTTLAQLDLSSNTLAGLLPVPWGTRLPALRRLGLTGNHVRGPIPSTWWLGGFADQGTVVDLRTSNGGASNEEVCGGCSSLGRAMVQDHSSCRPMRTDPFVCCLRCLRLQVRSCPSIPPCTVGTARSLCPPTTTGSTQEALRPA